MPRARLVDVATEAGVSTATASLVLRGLPGPSAASQRSVQEAAARLGTVRTGLQACSPVSGPGCSASCST